MLWQRVITALLLLPVVILAIFSLMIEYFAIAIGIIICIAGWEWSGFYTRKKHLRIGYVISMVLLMLVIHCYSLPMAYWHGFVMPQNFAEWFAPNQMALIALFIGLFWWLLALILLLVYPRMSQSIIAKPYWIIPVGWMMLIPTWVGAVGIRSMEIAFDLNRGSEMLLFVLLLVWAADTGAYFAGKNFGKRKLAAQVSPKKTWEGVYGGILLAAAVMVGGIHLLHFPKEQWLALAGLTVIIVAFSVIGDLTESIFKRLTGVKDSGRILPGHGGILDRIDGVAAVLPISLLGFSILGIK